MENNVNVRELSKMLDVLRFGREVKISPTAGIETGIYFGREIVVDDSVEFIEDGTKKIDSFEKTLEIYQFIKNESDKFWASKYELANQRMNDFENRIMEYKKSMGIYKQ